VEFQLFGPWSARLEYRYTDFGSFSKSALVNTTCLPGACSSPSPGATINLHPSLHTVRVGLGFGF
jgi:outer membrane immunogenic protein